VARIVSGQRSGRSMFSLFCNPRCAWAPAHILDKDPLPPSGLLFWRAGIPKSCADTLFHIIFHTQSTAHIQENHVLSPTRVDAIGEWRHSVRDTRQRWKLFPRENYNGVAKTFPPSVLWNCYGNTYGPGVRFSGVTRGLLSLSSHTPLAPGLARGGRDRGFEPSVVAGGPII